MHHNESLMLRPHKNQRRNASILGCLCFSLVLAGLFISYHSPGCTIKSLTVTRHAFKPITIPSPDSFWCEAYSNMSRFRSSMLSQSITGFDAFGKNDWQRFEVALNCPKNRPLQRYGHGDGSKLLCMLKHGSSGSCVIYSLGSAGNYKFERAVLNNTDCEVHTFDCTYDGRRIHPTRHHYHKWCVGSGEGNYRTWGNITQTLGHTRVDLLKMDVEGHEYPVLSSWEPSDQLPEQLSLELHAFRTRKPGVWNPRTVGDVGLVFLHLANLGYGPYAREVNEQFPVCCSEYSFMLVNPPGQC